MDRAAGGSVRNILIAAAAHPRRYAHFEARDILRPLHFGVSWVPVSAVEKHPERATEFLWR